MTGFQDHFSPVAATYARARPGYPPALFAWLAHSCAARDLAWDCATGSGQAAVGLRPWFARILATDASAAQLEQAQPDSGIDYRLAPAEHSGLPAASVDLITVAQALHWFDLPRFHREVRRVLKPDGLFAAWSYGTLRVADPAVDRVVQSVYHDTLGDYWPPERQHVETGYRSLVFPLRTRPALEFCMTADWTRPQLLKYVRSWSATARLCAKHGEAALEPVIAELTQVWDEVESTRPVTWPLTLLVGQPLDDSG